MSAEIRLDGALLRLDDETLGVLVERVAGVVAERLPAPPEPWIGSAEAAEYLGTTVGRVHQLVHQRRVAHRKDGSRLVFRRSDLDEALEEAER